MRHRRGSCFLLPTLTLTLTLTLLQADCDDAEAPLRVQIQSPLAGAHVGREVTVLGRAEGGREIARVDVGVDDGELALASGTNRFTHTFDSTQLVDGPHIIRAQATEVSGATTLDTIEVMVVNGIVPILGPAVRAATSGQAADAGALDLMIPIGGAEGELLVAFVAHDTGTDYDLPAPLGWTRVSTVTAEVVFGARTYVFWKTAGVAEPATVTFTPTPATYAGDMVGGIWAITDADPLSPIDGTSVDVMATDTADCTAPSLTTTVADTLLLYACARNNILTSFMPPPEMTEDWDIASTGTNKMSSEGAHQPLPTAGPIGDRTATSSPAQGVALGLAIRPR